MSSKGYIRIPRSLLDNPLWKSFPPAYKEIFLVILENVCFKPQKFDDHGHIIDLEIGQYCASHAEILAKSGKFIKLIEIERSIKKFILCQFVRQEVRYRKTIITITHPETYDLIKQAGEVESVSNVRQTCGKLEVQKKNVKKENNEKKENTHIPLFEKSGIVFVSFGSFVKLKETEHAELCQKFNPTLVTQVIEEMNDYCAASKPGGYRDYAAAIRQWIRRRQTDKKSSFSVDRRTKNINGTPVESPVDGRF